MTRIDAYPQERIFLQPLRDGSGAVQGYRVRGNAARNWARSSELFDDFLLGIWNGAPWFVTSVGVGSGFDATVQTMNDDADGRRGQGSIHGYTGTTAIGSADYHGYATVRAGSGTRVRLAQRIGHLGLATVGEDYVMRAGFGFPSLLVDPATNGCLFLYNRAAHGDFWICQFWANGGLVAESVTTKAPAASTTYQVLEIDIAAEGDLVSYFVDGDLVAEQDIDVASRWTGDCMFGAGIQKTAGLTSRSMVVDYIRLLLDGATDRG